MEEQKDLPKPQVDLPLPEKELPTHVETGRKLPFPKYVFLGIVFVILLGVIGGAYFLGRNSVFKELNPVAPAIPPPDEPKYDPTADWQIYQNSKYRFIFKYPKEWSQGDDFGNNLDRLVFGESLSPDKKDIAPGTAGFTIEIFQPGYYMGDKGSARETLTKDTDLIYFIRAINGLMPEGNFAEAKQQTKIVGGISAIKYTWGDSGETNWYLKNKGNIFGFNALPGKNTTDLESQFDQFLSTFKLTE